MRLHSAVAKQLVVVFSAVAVLAIASPIASAQVPPPTLTGESFLAGLFAPAHVGSVEVTSSNCEPTGTSTFTYRVSGPAAGPYPGTFTETGTVMIGPQIFGGTPPVGPVTSWTANFNISSSVGTVTGFKTLVAGASNVGGVCEYGTPLFIEQYSANTGPANLLLYTAEIDAGGAGYTDHGVSRATFNANPTFPFINNFSEDFVSQQVTTTPLCDENSQTDQDQILNDQGCQNP